MSSNLSLAIANLTSVAVIVFFLGFLAARIKSDVRIPEPVYQIISIYLLFGIGLKGGHSLKSVDFLSFIGPALISITLGLLIPLAAFSLLAVIKKLSFEDRGAIAAHYGSTSLVTFSAALLFMETNKIHVEGFATALLTLLEIPGVIVGVYLGARFSRSHVAWSETMREVITGKTVLLLVGGLIAGALTSHTGYEKVTPFFIDLQSGFLVLFLLHLGYLAGSKWIEIRNVGPSLAFFGVLFPITSGFFGTLAGTWSGLSIGGAAILGVLCASASYIAAPAAVSIGLPNANASLALISSVGVTFPFNLIVGIPLYLQFAEFLGK